MKWIIFLILFLLSCIASNTTTSTGGYREVYIDGCYYIITDQGGITHKANCTGAH